MIWPLLLGLLPRRAIVPALIVLITLNVVAVMGLLGVQPFETKHLIFKLPTATYAPILIGSLLAVGLNTRRFFLHLHFACSVTGWPHLPVLVR